MIGSALHPRTGGLLMSATLVLVGCASPRQADKDQVAHSAHDPAQPVATSSNPGDSLPAPVADTISEEMWAAATVTPISPQSATEPTLQLTQFDDPAAASEVELAALPDADAGASVVPIALAQPLELLPPTETPGDTASTAPAADAVPIDFATALAITSGQNPQVAFARQRINEAFAQMRAAEVLWVPTLRAGMNYNKHEGTIQDVAGNIIETSRGSVYTGLGAQAVGAGSPAVPGIVMNFHTKDMIFQPRITEQLLAASRQASRATTNDLLLDTALAYNDLLEAMEIEAIAGETLDNTRRLAEVTGNYAQAGQGLPSDADRAQAELASRQVEAQRTVEAVQVASIRLARLLSQDPTIHLAPLEPAIVPIDLAPMHCSLQQMVATSLSTRPELAESRFLVGAAVERLRREQNAPLVPSVLLGLSYGGNGGGLGSEIDNFGDRMDFDAVAYWELRNLGFGEQAARNEARARVNQARWRQVQIMDQVASDVAESYAQVVSRREQITLAQDGITAARESYRRNNERIQDALGLPIEALQAISALDNAQRQYVRSVADYNRAQFRLQRALGWPVQ
jgi:outer membrane protein TolC